MTSTSGSRWGRTFRRMTGVGSGVAMVAVLPAAPVAGAVSVFRGGTFRGGVTAVLSPVAKKFDDVTDRAEKFGDENSAKLTAGAKSAGKVTARAVLGLSLSALTGGIISGGGV